MQDPLKPYVPEFKQEFLEDGELYIQMQDLLEEFHSPASVMDCKMGIRYYQQNKTSELHLRKTYWTTSARGPFVHLFVHPFAFQDVRLGASVFFSFFRWL